MGPLVSKTSPLVVLYLPPLVPKQPTPLPSLSASPTIYFGSLNLIKNGVGVPYLIKKKKKQRGKKKIRGIITSKRTKIKNCYSDAGSHSAIFYYSFSLSFFFQCLFKSI